MEKAVASRQYSYEYADNTGIPDYVELPGERYPIRFRADSDQRALSSLRKSVGRSLLERGNHVVRRIVIGKLHPKILRTPDDPRMAASEMYREFTLQKWYFKRLRG